MNFDFYINNEKDLRKYINFAPSKNLVKNVSND